MQKPGLRRDQRDQTGAGGDDAAPAWLAATADALPPARCGFVVLTNLVGEHVFVTPDELVGVADGTCADQDLLARLRAAHLIQVPGETLPAELLAIKLRTRMRRLPDSTGLHIFVVTPALRAHLPVLPGVAAVGGEERVRHDRGDRAPGA